MASLSGVVCFLKRSWSRLEWTLMRTLGFDGQLAPALAVQGPGLLPLPLPVDNRQPHQEHSFLDNIFWMAAPKKRRTIEINRTRRRDPRKLIDVKTNIVPCPECGNMRMKHILCGFCYEKVRRETALIRHQIQVMEGGPLRTPAVPRVVLYEGEAPRPGDEGKQIVEVTRKRPYWFTSN